MGVKRRSDLTRVALIEAVQIYLIAVVIGACYLAKRLLFVLWGSKSDCFESRGNPPPCLTDTSLGQHSFIKIKGVKLHFVEAGSKTSPLLLLLHGFPDCWLSWRFQIPELSKHYRVIALDLKGFGDSDKPSSLKSYQIPCIVAELEHLVNELSPSGQVTIIGHGLGAQIGWFYLLLNSEAVNKFVSISSPHPNFYWSKLPNSAVLNSRWMSFCQLPILPELKAMEYDLNIINASHDHLLPNKPNDKEILESYKYLFSRKEDWTGALNYYRSLPFWRISPKSIDVPCLLIAGNKDPNIKLESFISSTDHLQKYYLKVIEGASHYPHEEKPTEVNKFLMDFLIDYVPSPLRKSNSDGLVYRMFDAVSSTVNAFQKKTGSITSRALSIRQGTY